MKGVELRENGTNKHEQQPRTNVVELSQRNSIFQSMPCRFVLIKKRFNAELFNHKNIYASIAWFRSRLPVVFHFLFNSSLNVLNLICFNFFCFLISFSLSLFLNCPLIQLRSTFVDDFCCTFVFNFFFFFSALRAVSLRNHFFFLRLVAWTFTNRYMNTHSTTLKA